MSSTPPPIFSKKIKKISWVKIYTRDYGVAYSEIMMTFLAGQKPVLSLSQLITGIIIPDATQTALYVDKKDWKKLNSALYARHGSSMEKLLLFEKKLFHYGRLYVATAKKISRSPWQSISNQSLLKRYLTYQTILRAYSMFVYSAFVINNFVSQQASAMLNRYLAKTPPRLKDEIEASLLQPSRQAVIIKLQNEVWQHKNSITPLKRDKLFNQYRWLSCMDLHNSPWSRKQCEAAINTFMTQAPKKIPPYQRFISSLKMKKKDVEFLHIAKRLAYLKDARDEFRRQAIFYALPFFAEIAKRVGIGRRDISFLASTEIISSLRNNRSINKNIIQQRKKGFIMYFNPKFQLICLADASVKKALNVFRLSGKVTTSMELKGNIASRGKAAGIVTVVRGVNDLRKVKNGAIFVAVTTHPDYTVAMRKAAAIVTDEGGITSHAGIIAREFGIPCIVGTQTATRVLKDGIKVIVDADQGVIIPFYE